MRKYLSTYFTGKCKKTKHRTAGEETPFLAGRNAVSDEEKRHFGGGGHGISSRYAN